MSQTSLQAFRGVVCPSFTPFRNGTIDFTALERHFARLTESGINGILLSGSLGEFPSLSLAERLELIHCARSMTSLPIIVNVATTCMNDMWQLADAASQQGYEALMTLPPYYFGQTPVQLEAYFTAVEAHVSLPWFIYNFPARTGCDVDAALMTRLVAQLPNLCGIKDTVDCASHTRAIVHAVKAIRPDFMVFSGFDEYFIPNLMNGGDGVLSGLTNIVPEVFVALRDAYNAGRLTEVAALHRELGRLSAIYSIGEDFVTSVKAAVAAKYGYLVPESRNYGGALSPAQEASIRDLFGL